MAMLGGPGAGPDGPQLGVIMETEPCGWTSFGGLGTDNWRVRIGREIRRYRHVPDIAAYWKLRPKPWAPDEPPAAATGSAAQSIRPMSVLGQGLGPSRRPASRTNPAIPMADQPINTRKA
jgi:hypothetical protein